ncbi:MAG: DNA-processing protein DprA [Deltaproteobacteria bacterium]|nr:DNA-processing protein DprA [Deltaproteobacteria bacterium]
MEGENQAASREELQDWLALRLIPGVGSVAFARLLAAFGSPGQALGAGREELRQRAGLRPAVAEAVSRRAVNRDPAAELSRLEDLGGRLVILTDTVYPPLLREIFAPPPVLYVRGDLAGCRTGGVALVGSRHTSAYGRRLARDLAQGLAAAGLSVISGLARGVDAAAHQAALEAGGHTVGVLGSGLNVAYPPENAGLMADMARQGAVVSEFPLDEPPHRGHFPVRNRLISGLSRAVVVVEAGTRSGALITARHALDQGRQVFAVPGPVGAPLSQGCNELIQAGAGLITRAADLLEPAAMAAPPAAGREEPLPPPDADLPAPARELLEYLSHSPVHLDVLARESGLKPQEVTALLVLLELAGRVVALPGKNYVLS